MRRSSPYDTILVVDGVIARVWSGDPHPGQAGELHRVRPGSARCGMGFRGGAIIRNRSAIDGSVVDQASPATPPIVPSVVVNAPVTVHVPPGQGSALSAPNGSPASLPGDGTGAVDGLPAPSAAPVQQISHVALVPTAIQGEGHASALVAEPRSAPEETGNAADPSSSGVIKPETQSWSWEREAIYEACARAVQGHAASRALVAGKAAAAGLSIDDYCAVVMTERARLHAEILTGGGT